ncbi:glycosyltransferase family 39 protein [Salinigranum marinum]|uniref:ArnT family glycosyltransferase n=1 Tax=Salinigranum marinum TaxID=1515595 RepID=UPI002989F893|nr:glycosyltransferase family 39 protein [Salinigranum marinum]
MRAAGVVDLVASRTNVDCRHKENHNEYFDRLDDIYGVDEVDRERLNTLATRETLASSATLSETEKREVEEICNRILDTGAAEADETKRTRVIASDASGSSGSGTKDSIESFAADRSKSTSPRSGAEPIITSSLSSQLREVGGKVRQDIRNIVSRTDLMYLVPLIACGVFVFFYRLGDVPLQTWDEGFYANLARHMIQDGYWVVPHMYYTIGFNDATLDAWLRLPPLGVWLQALSMLVFGINEFAVRLPSAAASLLTGVVIYFIGRSSFSRRSGFFASLVYLTTPWVHSGFNAGRDGGLDALLVLFGTLFVYTAWLAVKRNDFRWFYPMGVFAGLAVLTKGFGAGVFLLVVLPIALFNQRVFVTKEFARSVGVTVLLILPWPIYIYSQYGEIFIREAFVRYILDRAAGNEFGATTNAVFPFMDYPYIKSILFDPSMLHPWVFVLLFIIPVFVYRRVVAEARSGFDAEMLVWWTLVSFVLFVFIGEKQWYIMPMYVPAALLVGYAINAAIDGRRAEIVSLAAGIAIVLTISPAFSLGVKPGVAFDGSVILSIGTVAATWALPVRRGLTARLTPRMNAILSRIAPLVVAVVLIAALVGVPSATGGNAGQQALAVELDEHAPPDAVVFIEARMNRPFHTFSFYAQRPLDSGTASELAASGSQYAVLRSESLADIEPGVTVLMNATLAENQEVSLVYVEDR